MAFSDTVKRVIELADAATEAWDRVLHQRHPNYPLLTPGVDEGPPPPEEAELEAQLRSLPPADIYKLLALMYLGRGDFNAIGYEAMSQDMVKTFPDLNRAIRHLVAKAPLGVYLADGLQELTNAGIDIDHLDAASV